ncbi:hypothetical protein OROHE_026505 [Orobanche hederae]
MDQKKSALLIGIIGAVITLSAYLNTRVSDTASQKVDAVDYLGADTWQLILSLIPTKFAVALAAVSPKWELLLKDTELKELEFSDIPDRRRYAYKRHGQLFVKYVDYVLKEMKIGEVRKVKLMCVKFHNPQILTQWIDTIWRKCPLTHFDLQTANNINLVTLPSKIITSASLKVLKLHTPFKLFIPDNGILFPSVTTMEVLINDTDDENWDGSLFSRCPSLTDLTINSLIFPSQQFHLQVNSETLKKLQIRIDIYKCYMGKRLPLPQDNQFLCAVSISCAILESLDLSRFSAVRYDVKHVQVLNRLKINLGHHYCVQEDFYDGNITHLVRRCAPTVEFLSVASATIPALCRVFRTRNGALRFISMKRLELHFDGARMWAILPDILHVCPKLEFLHIQKDRLDRKGVLPESPGLDFWSCKDRADCMRSALKEIVIKGYESKIYERMVVKRLLRLSYALERMSIHYPEETEERETILKRRILWFRRGSKRSWISFYSKWKPQ